MDGRDVGAIVGARDFPETASTLGECKLLYIMVIPADSRILTQEMRIWMTTGMHDTQQIM